MDILMTPSNLTDRFVFEKTFVTCNTLHHLQGALQADTVYMELLQVTLALTYVAPVQTF